MKKKIALLLLIFAMIISCGIFAACGGSSNNNNGGNNSPIITGDIAGLKMDLSGAKQLGITTYGSIKPAARMSAGKGRERSDDEQVLVKIDKNGNAEEVGLIGDEQEPEKTIDDYDLEVYQMYTFGEFTAVSYISSYWREVKPELEFWYHERMWIFNREKRDIDDSENFRNNAVMKSYLIHNQTGKIYSTEQITHLEKEGYQKHFHIETFSAGGSGSKGGFLRVCAGCENSEMWCRKYENKFDWLDISINENGGLEAKNILPNKDYTVQQAFKDAGGWTYVATDFEEINKEKKTVYFESDYFASRNAYKLASNGKVYVLSQTAAPFEFFMENGEKKPISREDSFESINDLDGVMAGGVFYYNGSSSLGSSLDGYYTRKIGFDCVDKKLVEISEKNLPYFNEGSFYGIENHSDADYLILRNKNSSTNKWELYYIRLAGYADRKPQHTYYDFFTLDVLECELLLSNFVLADSDSYHYHVASSQGTIVYSIVFGQNGKPELKEYSSTSYEFNLITIQPLN